MLGKAVSDTSHGGLKVSYCVVDWITSDDFEAVVRRDEVDCITALPPIRVLVVESGQ